MEQSVEKKKKKKRFADKKKRGRRGEEVDVVALAGAVEKGVRRAVGGEDADRRREEVWRSVIVRTGNPSRKDSNGSLW